MKKLLVAILFLATSGLAQDYSQTAKRIWGNNVSPTSCVYSATADPVIIYSGTLYVCGVGNTFAAAGGGGSGTVTSATIVQGTGVTLSGTCTSTTILNCTVNAVGTGANTALSNLASVAINTDLLPTSAGSSNIGSALLPWGTGYFQSISVPGTGSVAGNIGLGQGTAPSLNANQIQFIGPASVQAAGWQWVLPGTENAAIGVPQLGIASGHRSTVTLVGESGTGNFCMVTNCALVTPNLGVPSSLDLANATDLPAAAIPLPTATAIGGAYFNYLQNIGGVNNTAALGAITTGQIALSFVNLSIGTVADHIVLNVQTADNSANQYDIVGYGPKCDNTNASVPLAFHTGAITSSTYFSATGTSKVVPLAQTYIFPSGMYCVGFTSGAASPTLVLGGTTTGAAVFFATNTKISGGGNTGPSTITAPAASYNQNGGQIAMQLYFLQ